MRKPFLQTVQLQPEAWKNVVNQLLMASGGDRRLPELRITYKQLEKRGRELSKRNYGEHQQRWSDDSLGNLRMECNSEGNTCSKNERELQHFDDSILEQETSTKDLKASEQTPGKKEGLLQIKPTQGPGKEDGRSYAPGGRTRLSSAERHRRGKSDSLWQQRSSARKPAVDLNENERHITVEAKQETSQESDGHCSTRGLIQVDQSVLNAASNRKKGNKGAHKAASVGASRPLGGESAGRRRHSSEGSPRLSRKDVLDPEVAGLLADVKHSEGEMERAVARWSYNSAGFDYLLKIR